MEAKSLAMTTNTYGIARLPGLAAVTGLLLCFSVGCDRGGDPPVNTADAEQQLRVALDAWKGKEPFGSLASRQPSIHFNEPLWKDGAQLIDFELGPVELYGRQGRCTVKLSVQTTDGKRQERRIGYLIDTTPSVVIVREGLGG
jgi:hypothetical protein